MLSYSQYTKNYFKNINDINQDATVISKKGDHKFIFLKENKPNNLNPDPKNRVKGEWYIRNNRKIYPVIVDMFEHPTIISRDNDFADIWIVDSLNQAQKQLDLIIKHGAKQFYPQINR